MVVVCVCVWGGGGGVVGDVCGVWSHGMEGLDNNMYSSYMIDISNYYLGSLIEDKF